MNINCLICSDLFVPSSIIYITPCGHIFHHTCLIQWIERSRTCPQCRNKTTEKTVFRVYFNLISGEGIVEDAASLQNKVDSLNLQLRLKENHIKCREEELDEAVEKKKRLEEKILNLQSECDKYKSGLGSLKDQVTYFKAKATHVDKMEREIKELKEQLRAREDTTKVLTGTLEETQKIINANQSYESLAYMTASLKKELLYMQNKRDMLFSSTKRKENELSICRKENSELKEEIELLKAGLKSHEQCEAEILTLKMKISSLSATNPSLQRVLTESPAPKLTKPKAGSNISFEDVESPSLNARIKEIRDSDSPYLKVKSNNMALQLQTHDVSFKFNSQKTSIFKKSSYVVELNKKKTVVPEGNYNGLGGHSKDDLFPVPRPSGVKRPKSATVTSSKFRKLAKPSKKIDDYVNFPEIE